VLTTLRIGGMLAVHAKRAVFTALSGVEGIHSAEVELGRAVIDHDGRATPALLRQAVETAGFEVEEVVEERRRLPMV
jgi:copper chaperone CopZ